MYVLQQNKTNTDKVVAAFVTTFLMMVLYFGMHWTNLPELREKTESYDEINWTRFKPKPQAIVEAPKPVKIDQPVKFEPKPAVPPKPTAVEKVDLSTLKNATFESLSKPAASLNKKAMTKEAAGASAQTKIDLKNSAGSGLGGLKTLSGESSQKLKLPMTGRRGGGGSSSTSLALGSGKNLESGSDRDYGGGTPSLGAPQTKQVGGGAAQVAMVDMSQLGNDLSNLSPIYHELVEWMKSHPAEFSEVVKRFMEKSPGDLTAIVNFRIGGREFQMFLMCKEKLFEVRICLLEGNDSTYLIDRGLNEKSSFLRIGSVSRASSGEILAFGTVRQAASSQRTEQFYQIFLSWWESVKQ